MQAQEKQDVENTEVNSKTKSSLFARNLKIHPCDEPNQIEKDCLIGSEQIQQKNHKAVSMQTFLISSVRPSLKVKDIFKKVLRKNRQSIEEKAVKKPMNVIKMSIIYVEKFIRIVKSQSSAIRFRQCGKNQINIIGDKSSDYKYYLLKRYFYKEIYRWLKNNILTKWNLDKIECLILPNSKMYVSWSIFLLIVLCLNVLFIPLQISFNDIYLSPFADVCLNTLPNLCFIFEILLKFNTAIYKKGLIIKSRKEIVFSYLQKRFWYDVFIVFCFLMGSYLNNGFLQSTLLLRYFDIVELIGNLVDRYNLRERFYGIIDLIKLIFFILLIAHLCGCIWHYIAITERNNGVQVTWLNSNSSSLSDTWEIRYINSLYWSVVTMCTLGYGDIVPVTPTEKLFTIGVTLISCFVFGYSVNQIGDILKEFFRIEEEFKVKMAKLNIYMKKRELNDDVSVKVRKYFEYLHKEQLFQNIEGATLINSLEQDLKSEVLKDIYGKLLRTKKLFVLNFNVDSLSVKVKEKTIGIHEYVYKEGDASENIFFLLRGQLEVIKPQTSTIFQTIEKGMMFGEIEFFTGQMRQFAIRSNSVAQLAYLSKEDFMEVIRENTKDFEKFKQMQDQIYNYQDTHGMDHQCGSCGKFSHLQLGCPQINIQVNKSKILQKYKTSSIQERKKGADREKPKQEGGISGINWIFERARQFQINEGMQVSDCDAQSENKTKLLNDEFINRESNKILPQNIVCPKLNLSHKLAGFDLKSPTEQRKNNKSKTKEQIGKKLEDDQFQKRKSFEEDDIFFSSSYKNYQKFNEIIITENTIAKKVDEKYEFTQQSMTPVSRSSYPFQLNEIPKCTSIFTLPSYESLADDVITKCQNKRFFEKSSQFDDDQDVIDKSILRTSSQNLKTHSKKKYLMEGNLADFNKCEKNNSRDYQFQDVDDFSSLNQKEIQSIETNKLKLEISTTKKYPQNENRSQKQFNEQKINLTNKQFENKEADKFNQEKKAKKQEGPSLSNNKSINLQNIQKKVSIIVSKPGCQEINLTLSVNDREKDQLREVLELEQNLSRKESLLKKTIGLRSMNKRIEEEEEDQSHQINSQTKGSPQSSNLEIFRVQSQHGLISPINIGNGSNKVRTSFFNHIIENNNQEEQFTETELFELKKYDQINLKHYDDEFISIFDTMKEFQEYYPKNNCSNVIEMISIRRKINPFYRELLIKKKQQSQQRQLNSMKGSKRYGQQFKLLFHTSQMENFKSGGSTIQGNATPKHRISRQESQINYFQQSKFKQQ